MSHLRRDPVTGSWVIIAPDRARRPRPGRALAPPIEDDLCPFCPGHESATPPSVLSIPDNGAAWQVRVVPNRYPALRVEGTIASHHHGVFDRMSAVGAHEVIIETPTHDDLPHRSVEDITTYLQAIRSRLLDLRSDRRLLYIMAFKNEGDLAGATVPHPHSQILATPTIPTAVETELSHCDAHFQLRGRCLFCDILNQELQDGQRLVYDTDAVAAVAPYASRFPFEVWLLPKAHQSHFDAADDALLRETAKGLKEVMGRIAVELERPSYNLVFHTAPAQEPNLSHYHWHLEIIPCLQPRLAGFELGSGYFINPTPPEEAARHLRQADPATLRLM